MPISDFKNPLVPAFMSLIWLLLGFALIFGITDAAMRRPSRLSEQSLDDIRAENEAMHRWWCNTQQNPASCSLLEKVVEAGGTPSLDREGREELVRMHEVSSSLHKRSLRPSLPPLQMSRPTATRGTTTWTTIHA